MFYTTSWLFWSIKFKNYFHTGECPRLKFGIRGLVEDLNISGSVFAEDYFAVTCSSAVRVSVTLKQPVVFRQIFTSISMTGTSINTPTTVARAAPEDSPKSTVAVAMATSK